MTYTNIRVILLGVVGAFLVSGANASDRQLHLGIVFPVLAGFFYALYLWLKRQAPMDTYTPYQVLFNTFMFALPFLLIFWLVFENVIDEPLFVGILVPNSWQLILLVAFAVFSTILPHGLLNYVDREEVSPTAEGLLLRGDPLLHTLWASLFFGQFVSGGQYVGALLILVSAALSLRPSSSGRRVMTNQGKTT